MIRITSTLLMLCVMSWAISVRAAQELFFTGLVSPVGSISNEGSLSRTVFLRWNEAESALPDDFAGWRIYRDGDRLDELPATGVMSANQIDSLYSTSADVRAFAEMRRWLDDLDDATTVNGGNFSATLRAQILTDPLWSHLAARIDIRVAQARYRAFRDDAGAKNGTVVYELTAVSTSGAERRMGRLVLDTDTDTVLPPVSTFEQVKIGRCDAPEAQKDHGVVTFNWDHPGSSAADRYSAAVSTAGYDLYRSSAALSPVPTNAPLRDLRDEAAGTLSSPDGTVQLSGLTRVNDTLIMISGTAATEGNRRGHNADFSQYQESVASLQASGLNPGDTMAYYLVARDLSGNYGETAAILATVPDHRRPPAPWSVETWSDSANDDFELVWDQVNVRNYHRDFQQGRTYCNLDTARFDNELRFVPEGETCESATPVEIELGIDRYLIYRFLRSDQAENFSDRDGDGFSDADERTPIAGLPGTPGTWTSPGTACDVSEGPSEGDSYLIGEIKPDAAVKRPSGREVIEFEDSFLSSQKSDVYWYRVASVSRSGQISELSAPIRGLFKDRTRPGRDDLDGVNFGVPTCNYSGFLNEPPNGTIPFAIDDSMTGVASSVRAGCDPSNFGPAFDVTLSVIDEATPGIRGAILPPATCTALVDACSDRQTETVDFLDSAGAILASVVYPDGMNQCVLENAVLTETCGPGALEPIDPGETLLEPPTIDYPGATQCVGLYREVGDTTARLQTICPGEWPVVLDLPGLAGEPICLSVALHNENNVVSSKRRLNCFRTPSEAPGTPQLVDFVFDPGLSTSTLRWRPPNQALAGTIIEWKNTDGSATESTFVPHAGQTTLDGEQIHIADLGPAPISPESEEWCFRARSVGYAISGGEAGQLSEWSDSLCGVRMPLGEDTPAYLPWPRIPAPPVGDALEGRYLGADGLPSVLLGSVIDLLGASCDLSSSQPCGDTQACFPQIDAQFSGFGCPKFCSIIRAGMGSELGFVAYRQSRPAGGGTESEFVQVSPLIDRAHCETMLFGGTLQDPYVKYANFENGDEWEGGRTVYVDRFPHAAGREYRYQFVYFGPDGEITGYRTSNWLEAL